jgi:hypothetical protein
VFFYIFCANNFAAIDFIDIVFGLPLSRLIVLKVTNYFSEFYCQPFSSFSTSLLPLNSSSDADNFTCGTTLLDASMESLLNFAYSSSPLSTFEWIVYRHHFS